MALTRPDVRSRFFRIVGIGPNDGYFRELESDQETAINSLVMEGLWNAQAWMVTFTPTRRWRKRWTIEAGEVSQDTTIPSAPYYANLPEDFMALDGDTDTRAAVLNESGYRHGQYSTDSLPRTSVGDFYWLEGERIYFSVGSRSPVGLVVNYIYWHPDLNNDSSEIEFPRQHLDLIAYEAAMQASTEDWVPMTSDVVRRASVGLVSARKRIAAREKRSRTPALYNHGRTERSYSTQRMN